MSKKHKTKVELVPWMSARADNVEKRFIQVGNANVDGYYGYQFEQWLNKRYGCPMARFPDYLFNLEIITDLNPREGNHWFFDFQIPVVQKLCKTGAGLASMPEHLLDEFTATGFKA